MNQSEPRSGRLIGIDFGTLRTGIAVSDPLRMFAQPHGTFSPDAALDELERLDRELGAAVIVLGWPLTLEGHEQKATRRVDEYANRIRKRLPGVPVVRWDERYSSVEARELLIGAGVGKKRRSAKGRVDAAAAAVILQSYLESEIGQ